MVVDWDSPVVSGGGGGDFQVGVFGGSGLSALRPERLVCDIESETSTC